MREIETAAGRLARLQLAETRARELVMRQGFHLRSLGPGADVVLRGTVDSIAGRRVRLVFDGDPVGVMAWVPWNAVCEMVGYSPNYGTKGRPARNRRRKR